MTPNETLLVTFAVTIIGSGLGTTIIGAWFKRRFDSQLETHKALLQRSGKIHERQVVRCCIPSIQNLRKRSFICSERHLPGSSQARHRTKRCWRAWLGPTWSRVPRILEEQTAYQ